jgi:hypothetical protein
MTTFHTDSTELDKFTAPEKKCSRLHLSVRLSGLRERLGWMDKGCEVQFEGQIDIGSSNGPRMKMISPVCDEKEWTAYADVVMKSEIHVIELVARMIVRNNVGDESSRSPTLPKAVDEQHVECGVVLAQSS